MKKSDFIYLSVSIFINLIIVFLINYEFSFFENKNIEKVKIGLVETYNNNTTKFEAKENKDSNKEINNSDENKNEIEIKEKLKKKDNQKEDNYNTKKNNEINEEKIVEKKVEINTKKEIKENDKKEIKKVERKKQPSLDELNKLIESNKPNVFSNKIKKDGEEDKTDRILASFETTNGQVSGSKFGDADGKIMIKWNPQNIKPKFPESAELSGKNGRVSIVIKVDEFGNIVKYRIDKGSGVPEIDASIERIISTWKINLIKNEKNISGTFNLYYNFNLGN